MKLRLVVTVSACAALLASFAPAASAEPNVGPTIDDEVPGTLATEAPYLTYTYEVGTRGQVATDVGAFAADAREILSDARSWTLGGSIRLVPVASGGDFNLILASPQAVDAAHEVCSPDYSCRVGEDVLINDRNWRNPPWGDAGPTWFYRHYLINHEVGHYLGFDDLSVCPTPGELAPVMLQQSIDLDGCVPNGWPLDSERQDLADRLGVPIHEWVFPDVVAHHEHRDAIHAVTEAGIAEGYPDGYYRPQWSLSRGQMASLLTRALDLTAQEPPPFDDVSTDHAHADGIAAVVEADIAEGFGDGTFRPSASITRAQMASMLAAAFDLDADGPPPFDDVSPEQEHAAGIAAVAEHEVALGYGDGTFRPDWQTTRAQMASFIARAHSGL